MFQSTLQPPKVNGPDEGDLLIVGWGSTKGAIEEALEAAQEEGLKVSSLNLTFLSPLEPGLKEIFSRFKKVCTVEINYSDEPDDPYITPENRRVRPAGLAPQGEHPGGHRLLDPGSGRTSPPRCHSAGH